MMGFSRDSAVFLKKNFSKHLKLDNEMNKLIIMDKELIKRSFKKDGLHYLEIQSLL